MDTYTFYDDLSWGIEAVLQLDGKVCAPIVGECHRFLHRDSTNIFTDKSATVALQQ